MQGRTVHRVRWNQFPNLILLVCVALGACWPPEPVQAAPTNSCANAASWNYFTDTTNTCALNPGSQISYSITGIPSHYCINDEWYVSGYGLPLSSKHYNNNSVPKYTFTANAEVALKVILYDCSSPWKVLSSQTWDIKLYPAVPSSISASNVGSSGATISWTKGTGASTTSIEYKKSSSSTWTSKGSVTEGSYSLTGLSSGTTYDIRLQSKSASNLYSDNVIKYALFSTSSPTGSYQVNIAPSAAAQAGAQWRIDGGAWKSSGNTVSGLSPDCTHSVEYQSITGWVAPATNSSACVSANLTVTVTGTYSAVLAPSPSLGTPTYTGSVVLGDWASISIPVTNVGGVSKEGGITVSFPSLTLSSDFANVYNDGSSTNDSPGYLVKKPGDTIYNRYGSAISAQHLLVEYSDLDWTQNEANTLKLKVKPKATGTFDFYVRSAMQKSDNSWINTPTSGSTDQQSWNIKKYSITVSASTGSLTVSLSPASAVTAGAQWRVDSGNWNNSGTTVSNLAPGSHTVDYKPVSGWKEPASENVTVLANQLKTLTGRTYSLSSTTIASDPDPAFGTMTYDPSIVIGDWATITIPVSNAGGDSKEGGISVSFPKLNATTDNANVENNGSSNNDSPGFIVKRKGDTIYDGSGNAVPAEYLLVEYSDASWTKNESNTLKLKVKPKVAGTFEFYVRSTMQKADGKWVSIPNGSQYTDQQKWSVVRYSIAVQSLADDYGDILSDATLIAADSEVHAKLNSGQDIDVFKLEAFTKGEITLQVDSESDQIIHAELLDSLGNLVTGLSNVGTTTRFKVSGALGAGVYYIRVRSVFGYIGEYTLSTSFTLNSDDYGNAIESANSIKLAESINGELEVAADSDYFKVVVPAYGKLEFKTTGTTDTAGYLIHGADTILAYRDDGGAQGNFRICSIVDKGTYYLKVKGYNSKTVGKYGLETSFESLSSPDDPIISAAELHASSEGMACDDDEFHGREYENGQKWLFYLGGSTDRAFETFSGFNLNPSVGLRLSVDLADVLGISEEGKNGRVTYWLHATGSLYTASAGVQNDGLFDLGFTLLEFDPNANIYDPRRQFSGSLVTADIAGLEVSAGNWNSDSKKFSAISFDGANLLKPEYHASVSFVSGSFALFRFEIDYKQVAHLLEILMNATPSNGSLRELSVSDFFIDLFETVTDIIQPFTSSDSGHKAEYLASFSEVTVENPDGGINLDSYFEFITPLFNFNLGYLPNTAYKFNLAIANLGNNNANFTVQVAEAPPGWFAADALGYGYGDIWDLALYKATVGLPIDVGQTATATFSLTPRSNAEDGNLVFKILYRGEVLDEMAYPLIAPK